MKARGCGESWESPTYLKTVIAADCFWNSISLRTRSSVCIIAIRSLLTQASFWTTQRFAAAQTRLSKGLMCGRQTPIFPRVQEVTGETKGAAEEQVDSALERENRQPRA